MEIKKQTSIFILFWLLGFINSIVFAQVEERLEGEIIGSVSYSSNNSLEMAFDANPNTWFKAKSPSGGWVGLDLGKKHVISKIEFQTHDVVQNTLGVFEGANNPDFGDAIPLFIIKEELASQDKQTFEIHNSRGFRFIRYVGPSNRYCRVAELSFYGYESAGNDNQLYQLTNIPTVSIHTKDAEDIIEKKKYLDGVISIISENGQVIYTDSLQIRGRGNASWDFPKKPYKFKLNNKANLLGFPSKEKNWTLINNYGDKTLMRNLLAFDLSKQFDMAFSPAGSAVDVLLNGEYKGTYHLSDQIEVAAGRVEVEEIKENDVDNNQITGGYLLEIDAYAYYEDSWFESSNTKIPVTIKYPKKKNITSDQYNYIRSHFNKMESSVLSSDFINNTPSYRDYLHVPSFVRHMLIGELSGNTDTYWSTYLYKKREDDLFYFGPVWDFDLAFENDKRTYPINEKGMEWLFEKNGSNAKGMKNFVQRLLADDSFYSELRDIYSFYRENGVLTEENLSALVDKYEQEIFESQKLNFTRWDILDKKVHMNFQSLGSFEDEVAVVRDYLIHRIRWMDEKLAYIVGGVDDEFEMKTQFSTKQGVLTIAGLHKNSLVSIIDISGRVISQKLIDESTDYSINLPKGVYIVKIQRNYFSSNFIVEKVIIN